MTLSKKHCPDSSEHNRVMLLKPKDAPDFWVLKKGAGRRSLEQTILSDPDWREWLKKDERPVVITEGVLDYQGEEGALVLCTKPIPVDELKPLSFGDRVKVTLRRMEAT